MRFLYLFYLLFHLFFWGSRGNKVLKSTSTWRSLRHQFRQGYKANIHSLRSWYGGAYFQQCTNISVLFNVGSTIISMHNSNFYNSRKGKNAGVFNVQFTKENLRSYLPLTPMPKGHSDSIDDNLPAYLLYFIQRHASTFRYSISVQMHGFTCPYSFFLSNVRYRCPIALLSVLF